VATQLRDFNFYRLHMEFGIPLAMRVAPVLKCSVDRSGVRVLGAGPVQFVVGIILQWTAS